MLWGIFQYLRFTQLMLNIAVDVFLKLMKNRKKREK